MVLTRLEVVLLGQVAVMATGSYRLGLTRLLLMPKVLLLLDLLL